MTTPDGRLLLAADLGERLSTIDGVVGVTLGGSLARGRASPDSDIDLGIYYRRENAPDLAALRRLAAEIDASASEASVTSLGAWGPWIDGGAWLTVQGRRVDWLYRDLSKVADVVAGSEAGEIGRHIQPGHPHGFHSHIYLAEVHHGRILHDATGALAKLKARLDPYPEPLRRTLVETYLWQAGFALDISEKAARRGDRAYVAGCFFECVFDLVQVLYALNSRYPMNEKGAIDEMLDFEHLPDRFVATAHDVLGCVGRTPAEFVGNHARLRALLSDVTTLVHTLVRSVERVVTP